MKYDKKFKLKFIKYFKTENLSISKIARRVNIPKQTLARWIRLYKRYGEKGLENRKSGVKEKPINYKFEELVLNLWKKKERSSYKMRKDLKKDSKRNGYSLSEWSINKVYKKYKLIY